MSLEESIIDYLQKNPGCKAKDISRALGIEKTKINSLLYGSLKDICYSNADYGWFIKSDDKKNKPIREKPTVDQNVPDFDKALSDLCHYYLSCISFENTNGVSAFLTSKYSLPYAEIPEVSLRSMPDEAINLLNSVAKEKNLTGYIGYPVSIYRIQSRNGEFKKIAPIFLFAIEFAKDGPSIHSVPILNSEAVKQYSMLDQAEQISAILKLYEDLGLNNPEADVDIDDICARLVAIRDWPWKEEIATTRIHNAKPVSTIVEPGIYNRAVIITTERSPYTVGLENELNLLAGLSEKDYQGTALYSFVHPEKEIQPKTEQVSDTILEVLPLNTEQRNAIRSSANKKVMVVTGPPGTGKSQVVTDMIVNSAWQGKSVLFSSKNNKAVDVVETRANGLAKQPVVLRLGGTQFAVALAQAIENLFSKENDENSIEEYRYQEKLYKEKQKALLDIESAKKAFVVARNQLDRLEQDICLYPEEIRTKWYPLVDGSIAEQYSKLLDHCRNSYDHAVYQRQGLARRIIWPLIKRKAIEQTTPYVNELNIMLNRFGIAELPVPQGNKDDKPFNDLDEDAGKALEIIKVLTKYKDALRNFTGRKQLEEYDKELCEVTGQLSQIATNAWKRWLETRNISLSADEKKALFNFTTAMKLNEDIDIQQGSELSRAYHQAQKTMTRMIPCWAVTSLSVKSRVPFHAGLFDYVIIDEASQCDIASALPLLYRAKQAIIIGDEKQLHHISTMAKKQDLQLLGKNNVELSWSYTANSLFNFANSLVQYPFADKVSLRDHFRCCSEIINYSNNEFYGGMLRVATNYQYLKTPAGQKPGIRWINVKGIAKKPSDGSLINDAEAKAIVSELKRLVINDGYMGSIGVVAPFRPQADLITKYIELDATLQGALKPYHELLVDTVHKFQGDERDCMIFSVTAAHGVHNGALSFLQGNGNLFNVAVTRARAILVVAGDYEWASTCTVPYLKNFALYTAHTETNDELQAIGITNNAYSREYPSVSNPEQVSEWEKLLYMALLDAGICTIPQYPVDKYKLDLALIIDDRRLDIEVDGELYHKDWNGELCYRDKLRNQRMYELGWDVKRFWVYQIRDELPRCISEIQKWIESTL